MDETLGEAHTTLADVKADYDWDWVGAEKEFKRAIELNPSYATAHHWYAVYLSTMGRPNEALAEAKRAQELDPLSPAISNARGLVLYSARRYEEAIAEFRSTLELNAGFYYAHLYLGWAYEQEKRYEQAISEYQKVIPAQNYPEVLPRLARIYAAEGKRTEAVNIMSRWKGASMQGYAPCYVQSAATLAALGDTDQAFAQLEKAYEDRCEFLVYIKVARPMDPLRSDPRFQDLLRRMNFPP